MYSDKTEKAHPRVSLFYAKLCGIAISAILLIASCSSGPTAGLLTPPSEFYQDAVIQIFGARTKGTKRALAIHTWIVTKKSGEKEYTRHEIIGWRLRRTGSALVIRKGRPDNDWWGSQPELILDIRGEKAERLIPSVIAAINDYPYQSTYRAWPGPNSNTFTAFVGKQVPELSLDLPSTAIGKDYRELSDSLGMSPSGTGVQASLFGLLGITLGYEEGIELNLLGLNLELDIFDLALELPGFGRIGQEPEDTSSIISANESLKQSNTESIASPASPK